jgi:hypothetical protein
MDERSRKVGKIKFKIGTSIIYVLENDEIIPKNLLGRVYMNRSSKSLKNSLYNLFMNKLRLNYESYNEYYYEIYSNSIIRFIYGDGDLFDGLIAISINHSNNSVVIYYDKDMYYHDYILKLVSKLLFPRRTYKF